MSIRIIFIMLFTGFVCVAHAQKGEKSIAAGPLISVPLGLETGEGYLKVGLGAEIVGQYNFSKKSALLLKATLSSWGIKERSLSYETNRLTMLSVQGGYRYQFNPSRFFITGLVGVDIDLNDTFITPAFTLGTGKRLFMKDGRFVDVGIDFVGADAEERLNIKVIFSLFQWLPKQ